MTSQTVHVSNEFEIQKLKNNTGWIIETLVSATIFN